MLSSIFKAFKQWLWLMLAGFVILQLFFVGRVAFMAVVNPSSTAFERSQAWQIASTQGQLIWRQQWRADDQIAKTLKRAVLASEDSGFTSHNGIWWDAIEKAWQKNAKTQAKLEAQAAKKNSTKTAAPKIVGGSTITQQLAKNLQQILTLYLNHVEWGRGIFGAEAAAQHYFQKPASKLTAWEAARLAVMLPRPRYFEKLPQSVYLSDRAETIMARMNDVALP
jgi:monofunctional biosynthetic peptidoglycan transglycosylase